MREGGREPIFNLPRVVVLLLGVLVLVHLARLLLAPEADLQVIATFAFIPGRFAYAFDPAGLLDHLGRIAAESPEAAESGRSLLTYAAPQFLWLTPLSYAFLHGDATHLTFNCIWCAAFGSPVARRFGPARFLLLGLIGTLAGAVVHGALHLFDLSPVIGASAAVSAFMGAASRFVFQPGAGFGSLSNQSEVEMARLSQLPRSPQALAFIGFWFVTNLIFGLGGTQLGLSPSPIAWEAHIGGFVAGLLLAPIFDQRSKRA